MNLKGQLTPIWAKTHLFGEQIERYKGDPDFNLPSKPQLNRMLYGFERETLVVVGARTSEFKSGFCLDVGYELSLHHKVLYLSFEMTEKEAMFRLLCHGTKIPNTDFYSGSSDDYEGAVERFTEKFKEEKRQLIICEDRGKTWDDVMAVMDELQYDPPDVIIIDYIQCLNTKGVKREALDEYIRSLRRLAIEMRMCVIVCSQIGRSNVFDSKEPTMEGLKETGTLEEHADKVLILYYKCKRTPSADRGEFKVIVAKNKNGMTGYLKMRINPSTYTLFEIEKPVEDRRTEYQKTMEELNG